jgi:hypothetical protein
VYAWKDLTRLPEAELARLDIAAVNLVCAVGLPGCEHLDVGRCLRTVEKWTQLVKRYTSAAYSMREENTPPEFANSRAFFRVLCMITALQKHCGVRYNPLCMTTWDFSDPADSFIHGMIGGAGGTCASMPVLYAAVGRRLGYPIKLVHTQGHVFARWDDPEGKHPLGPDRLNIEATNRGLECQPDEFYLTWPFKVKESVLRSRRYLQSLTPVEELASFIGLRGYVLFDNLRLGEAAEAFATAMDLAPHDPHYHVCLQVTVAMDGHKPPPGLEQISEQAVKERERIRKIWEAKASPNLGRRTPCTAPT